MVGSMLSATWASVEFMLILLAARPTEPERETTDRAWQLRLSRRLRDYLLIKMESRRRPVPTAPRISAVRSSVWRSALDDLLHLQYRQHHHGRRASASSHR